MPQCAGQRQKASQDAFHADGMCFSLPAKNEVFCRYKRCLFAASPIFNRNNYRSCQTFRVLCKRHVLVQICSPDNRRGMRHRWFYRRRDAVFFRQEQQRQTIADMRHHVQIVGTISFENRNRLWNKSTRMGDWRWQMDKE